MGNMTEPARWLTRKETATYLRVGQSTLTRLVNDRTLTPHRIGGLLRFDREEIDQILTDSKGK